MLTPKDAAKLSHIGINRIRQLSKRRDFPCLRVGRRILIHEDEFKLWLKNQCVSVDKISKSG